METFQGNCHCGSYRFIVRLPSVERATACDCRLCHKLGALWAYPDETNFEVTKVDGAALKTYSSDTVETKFCLVCGSTITGKHLIGPYAGKLGVNIRTLIGVNPFKLQVEKSSIQGSKEQAPLSGSPGSAGEQEKTYTGSCHCGLVTATLKSKPLPQESIREDNCSICSRNAWIGIYPRKAQVTLQGAENAQDYLFGRKFTSQSFCKVCGVVVFQHLYGPPKHVVESWPAARQEVYRRNMDMLPVNIRVLDDVEWPDLKVDRSDVGTEGYALG